MLSSRDAQNLRFQWSTVERGSYFNSYEDGFDDVQGYTSCALPV